MDYKHYLPVIGIASLGIGIGILNGSGWGFAWFGLLCLGLAFIRFLVDQPYD
jgi:hypothetical protein